MTDELKDRLERLGARAPDGGDALERLRGARERRDRRRSRSALAVGLSIVIVGGLVAATTLRGDGTTPAPRGDDDPVVGGAWELPETPYLWPENWARPEDRDLLADVQAAAEGGDREFEWRLDPEQVVRRFLASVLAWDRPRIDQVDTSENLRTFSVTPDCDDEDCEWQASLTVHVAQPAGTGRTGVWSVLSAQSEALPIDGGDESPFTAGAVVEIDARLPDARSAHAGVIASNGCGDTVDEFALAIEKGTSELRVPSIAATDPACGDLAAGYVFVYAMDDTTVPTGDPLLEAAAIEYPWLTMLPVEVAAGDMGEEATPIDW